MTPDLFKAFADPARIRIVEFLKRADKPCCSDEDRVCACDIEGMLGLSQPTVSHHMKVLVSAGLVEAEKAGRFSYYRINRTAFARLAAWLDGFVGDVVPDDAPQPGERLRAN